MHEVWRLAEELGKDVFKADYCNITPLSGHLSLMMTLYPLLRKNSKIAAVDPHAGGYPGFAFDKIPEVFGCDILSLPYENLEVDVERSLQLISENKPDVVVLGASIILYPMPVKDLADAVHGYGGYLVYDGSHVLGLIAGGFFQEPLAEGADILLGSTHKSFFGPQGGIILTNDDEVFRKIEGNIFHKFVDNIHLNRVAALAVALEEAKKYGRIYAEKVVENAKTLAEALAKEWRSPFKSKRGFTWSHQIYLPCSEEEGERVRDTLEKSRIIVDMGVRFGVNEVTRRGMGYKDMVSIARLCKRALDGEDVSRESIKLALKHKTIKFA